MKKLISATPAFVQLFERTPVPCFVVLFKFFYSTVTKYLHSQTLLHNLFRNNHVAGMTTLFRLFVVLLKRRQVSLIPLTPLVIHPFYKVLLRIQKLPHNHRSLNMLKRHCNIQKGACSHKKDTALYPTIQIRNCTYLLAVTLSFPYVVFI